jgi:multidrug resistance efflux pump
LNRELARRSSLTDSNTSVSVWKKLVDSRKLQYDRMKQLADKKVVPAADLEMSKTDYEVCVAQYEHALRTLKYAQLLVDLAQTEYDEGIAKNKAAPNSVSEFELKKLKIKVELAKVKASEIE